MGEGSERSWLQSALQRSELPGILRGEQLAQAYASMDVFVFPSSTDTFGNVVLEAMASGVPAMVTSEGGPKFLVTPGQNGEIVNNPADFAEVILNLRNHPELLARMRGQARSAAERFSWDSVFQEVHNAYDLCFSRSGLNATHYAGPPRTRRSRRIHLQGAS